MWLTLPSWPLLIAGFGLLTLAGLALAAPPLYGLALATTAALALSLLVFLHPMVFVVAWLIATGATVEMAMHDLIGPGAFQVTIAAEKAGGILLATICALRWGARPDPFNPAWAFLLMAAFGLALGIHPDLDRADHLRSIIGTLAPFAFCFCRIPRDRALTMLTVIRWCPLIALALGTTLALAGLRPLFVEGGGARLAGLGHPAFLAGVTMVGVYACLIATYRRDHAPDRWLLGANLLILLATGARAPVAYTAAVVVLTLVCVPSATVPAHRRVFTILAMVCAMPVLLALAGDLSDIRLLHLLTTDAAHLSGRERLWPLFEAAADGAPWFGWGIGAGNIVVPPGSAVAKLLKTWAAHNEYLRIRVEGGWIGLALLVAAFIAWVTLRTARLPTADRWIMRLIFLAFAAHAVTDNVLISTPACVLFTFAAAVFASAGQPPAPEPPPPATRPVSPPGSHFQT